MVYEKREKHRSIQNVNLIIYKLKNKIKYAKIKDTSQLV